MALYMGNWFFFTRISGVALPYLQLVTFGPPCTEWDRLFFVAQTFKGAKQKGQHLLGLRQSYHQKLQVPKMEVLNFIRLFWGWIFPYISRIHTAFIGEDSCILGTWNVWWYHIVDHERETHFPETAIFFASRCGFLLNRYWSDFVGEYWSRFQRPDQGHHYITIFVGFFFLIPLPHRVTGLPVYTIKKSIGCWSAEDTPKGTKWCCFFWGGGGVGWGIGSLGFSL